MPFLLLGRKEKEPFYVDADLIATGRTCVLGASGSGKSYAIGVICEEFCRNEIPFALVDVEGEYPGIKEKYEVLWVGDDSKSDLTWDDLDFEGLAKVAPDSVPLILDVSETEDRSRKINSLLTGIYNNVSNLRIPYLFIIEEADRFAPQVGQRLQIFDEVARRGRKRGVGLMLGTQRPSLVDKNILSQCTNQLIGRLIIRNDLQSVSQFFPERGLPKQLTTLNQGEFYALGNFSPFPSYIKIRKRETRHGGITPKFISRTVKTSQEVLFKLQSRSKVDKDRPGLPVLFSTDDVSQIVKREKKYFFFGEEEAIIEINLVYHPLIELELLLRTGVLKKKLVNKYILLDGIKGRAIRFDGRIMFSEGLVRFIGLKAEHVELLRTLSTDIDFRLLQIAEKMKV